MTNLTTTAATQPLWQLEEELTAILDTIDVCPPEQLPELEARLAEYIAKEIQKVDRVAGVLASLEHVQSSAKAEIERLRARSSQAERAEDRLKSYILEVIRKRDGKPLKGATTTLSVRTSESLVITDPNLVPAEWKRTTVTVDIPKTPIKDALKAGQEIPGVVLQQNEHLVRK